MSYEKREIRSGREGEKKKYSAYLRGGRKKKRNFADWWSEKKRPTEKRGIGGLLLTGR